jgi:hypothetical protein
MCQPLGALVTSALAAIRAYVTESDGKIILNNRRRHGGAAVLRPEINAYDAHEVAAEVGDILSQSSNFLQPLLYRLEDVEYHSPHILKIAGYVEENLVSTPSPTPNDM